MFGWAGERTVEGSCRRNFDVGLCKRVLPASSRGLAQVERWSQMLFWVRGSLRHMSYSLARVSQSWEDESTAEKGCINSYSDVVASFISVSGSSKHLCTYLH